jgi:hypothetical protein
MSLRMPIAAAAAIALFVAAPAGAATPSPAVVHDVMTGTDDLGSLSIPIDPIQDYVQPDTQIEPSIAVNPANPCNVVAAYQEGRIANGGDATNGYAVSFDCGATWTHGELPGLTQYGKGSPLDQGGQFERASDAVVAFGPNNTVYANSLIFDQNVPTDTVEDGAGAGLRSGIATNVSYDGGKTWSKPAVIQDDDLGGQNDKNWIVVDNSDAPGHHKGRVYVIWDRGEPVVYDYCDSKCEDPANWLPDAQILDPVAFPGQGIGAYPLVMSSGALGMAINVGATPGVPTGTTDQPDLANANSFMEFIIAPAAGSTPYPAPLAWLPPIHVSNSYGNAIEAQRASDGGLPSAAIDPKSGTIYYVWDDGRFRKDGKNDVVITRSADEGKTWSPVARVNPPGGAGENHYNPAVAVGSDGNVHVMWRQRDESGAAPLFTDVIDTYYAESSDGGATWSAPLKVNAQPSNPWYGAFSRNGTFEGDYDEIASAGGYTYIVRDQGQKLTSTEPPALTRASPTTVALTNSGKGHQHQRTWVALVRDTSGG